MVPRPLSSVIWRTFPGARGQLPKDERTGTWPDESFRVEQSRTSTAGCFSTQDYQHGVETMSVTFSGQLSGQPTRRVRHEVRDGLTVIAFSAVASSALALALMLLVHLGD